jgi:hypothetical protein
MKTRVQIFLRESTCNWWVILKDIYFMANFP